MWSVASRQQRRDNATNITPSNVFFFFYWAGNETIDCRSQSLSRRFPVHQHDTFYQTSRSLLPRVPNSLRVISPSPRPFLPPPALPQTSSADAAENKTAGRQAGTHPVKAHKLVPAPRKAARRTSSPIPPVFHLVPHPKQRDVEDEEYREDADGREAAVESSRPVLRCDDGRRGEVNQCDGIFNRDVSQVIPVVLLFLDCEGKTNHRVGCGRSRSSSVSSPIWHEAETQKEKDNSERETHTYTDTHTHLAAVDVARYTNVKKTQACPHTRTKTTHTIGNLHTKARTTSGIQNATKHNTKKRAPQRPGPTAKLPRQHPTRRTTKAGCGPRRTCPGRLFCPRRPPPLPTPIGASLGSWTAG